MTEDSLTLVLFSRYYAVQQLRKVPRDTQDCHWQSCHGPGRGQLLYLFVGISSWLATLPGRRLDESKVDISRRPVRCKGAEWMDFSQIATANSFMSLHLLTFNAYLPHLPLCHLLVSHSLGSGDVTAIPKRAWTAAGCCSGKQGIMHRRASYCQGLWISAHYAASV